MILRESQSSKSSLVLLSGMLFCALLAQAYDWTGAAKNFILNDRENWEASSSSTDRYVMRTNPGGSLTLNGDEVSFFDGAMLRFDAAGDIVCDFGAGRVLKDVGKSAATGFHVESTVNWKLASGQIFAAKAGYLSDNATLTVDGPNSVLDVTGDFIVRSQLEDQKLYQPHFVVTNGAGFRCTGIFEAGAGSYNCMATFAVAGEGSRLWAANLKVGHNQQSLNHVVTNRFDVLDKATVDVEGTLQVGAEHSDSFLTLSGPGTTVTAGSVQVAAMASVSNSVLTVDKGGTLTLNGDNALKVGFGGEKKGLTGNVLRVTGEGSKCLVKGAASIYHGGTLEVTDGGKVSFEKSPSFNDGAALMVADKGAVEAPGGISVCSGRTVFSGDSLTYSTIYMKEDGAELVFTNAVVNGGRLEMTRRSTVRLINSQLTIPSGIFMMGDASGGVETINNLERHVYVVGSNSWVKVSQSNGFYVRGKKTTIHFEIPKEGYSTEHAVFQIPKVTFESGRTLTVEVAVDPALCEAGGGKYELFSVAPDADKCTYVCDPQLVRIVQENGKLYARVRSNRGMIVIFK